MLISLCRLHLSRLTGGQTTEPAYLAGFPIPRKDYVMPEIIPDADIDIDPQKLDWLAAEDIEEGEGE